MHTGRLKAPGRVGHGIARSIAWTIRVGVTTGLVASTLGTPPLAGRTAAASQALSVSVAYADTLRGGGSLPSPWQGSAGVNFVGGGSPYDSGAVEITNPGTTSISLDDVSVMVGSSRFDLWGSALAVPAGGSLILTQTQSSNNFDTSDASGATCSPDGLVPFVQVSVAGVTTQYADTNQVLNTGGIDKSNCISGANESQPWQQIPAVPASTTTTGATPDPALVG
jgi:hypothetical protein